MRTPSRPLPRPNARWLLLIALLFSLPLGAQTPAEDWTFVRGDTNFDGAHDISDPIRLLNELFVGLPTTCEDVGDFNDDGLRDIGDVIGLLGYLFAQEPPPPAPFPDCGVDPTIDLLLCVGPLAVCGPVLTEPAPIQEPPTTAGAAPNASVVAPVDRPGEGENTPAHSMHLFNGEFHFSATDVVIPGVGIDFRLTRTYRSRSDGGQWGLNYEILARPTGGGMKIVDGSGRARLYEENALGQFVAPGYFEVGEILPTNEFRLNFAGGGSWLFFPFDGSPDAGKLHQVRDRFGNTLTCSYRGAGGGGRVALVTDTSGREITFAYDANENLISVTDPFGRATTYDYYEDGDVGGSAGDLKSVTTPAVTGTPTGNDFPTGKTTTYTYTTGFADERLNHNLLTITDPKGRLILVNEYHPTTDPAAFEFDRCVRQIWGGQPIDYFYTHETPSAANNNATVRCVTNDRVGNVQEYFYDGNNNCVMRHAYTGRALPDLPTDLTTNRPGPPLRPTDPPLFETRWTYNADAVLTQIVWPRGNITEYVIDDSNPDPRMRGNVLEERQTGGAIQPAGDQDILTQAWTYLPGFGGALQREFATTYTDGRGNTTIFSFDPVTGARLQTQHPEPGVVETFQYDAFGRLTHHTHPASNDDPTSPVFRTDEFVYGTSLYLEARVQDVGGLNLTTSYITDDRGNVTAVIDSFGNAHEYIFNELDQVVREISREVTPGSGVRYEKNHYYDACDNLVRVCIQNRNEQGLLDPNNMYFTTIMEYDVLDRVTRIYEEDGTFDVPLTPPQLDGNGLPQSEFIVTEFEYDGNRNRVRLRQGESTNGNQPENVVRFEYDERDLVHREVRGEGGNTSTTEFDYDANGNLVRTSSGVESAGRDTTYEFDGFDRLTRVTDAMGNATTHHYDENSNCVNTRHEGETNDQPGSAGNQLLGEVFRVYDALDRVVLETRVHNDATGNPIGDGAKNTEFEYYDCGLVSRITDDSGSPRLFTYDSAMRPVTETDALGNSTTYEYDGNSNVVRVERFEVTTDPMIPSPPVLVTDLTYDGLDRRTSVTDPLPRTTSVEYDSRSNPVVTTDARGNETRVEYDGISRPVRTIRELNDGGVGSGALLGMIVTETLYDDSSRIVGQTDGNGNLTQFVYDALDRQTQVLFPDGTFELRTFDAHDDLIIRIDPNGTSCDTIYDELSRERFKNYIPGPGVAPTTTFEVYDYDGLSRLTGAQNDTSNVLRVYDTLSNRIVEVLNGLPTLSNYDCLGNRTQMIYPGGRQVSCVFDPLHRPQALQLDATGATSIFDYVGPKRLLRRVDSSALITDFQYDNVYRLTGTASLQLSTGVPITDVQFGYDSSDNTVFRQEFGPVQGNRTQSFSYDSSGRVIDSMAQQNGAPISNAIYDYDAAGNRLQVGGFPLSGPYFLDPLSPPGDLPMNQYTDTPLGQRLYDENGNRVLEAPPGLAPRQYFFDVHNRLVECFDQNAGLTRYEYDATDRRVRRTRESPAGFEDTRYYYDGWHVIEEQDGTTGATNATYVYGAGTDEIITMQRVDLAGTVQDYFYACDPLGNVTALTDGGGNPVEFYSYDDTGAPSFSDAFGNPIPNSQAGNPYLFTGRRYEDHLGLYDYRARFYDPGDGRFISRDPLGAFADPLAHGNANTYCGNNYYSKTDPTGMMNKAELIEAMASSSGLSKADAKRALNATVNATNKALKKGDRVALVGFGSFSISKRAARTGRNPQTGKEIKIAAKSASAPRDAASGMATGKRQHKPFTTSSDSGMPDSFFDITYLRAADGGHEPFVFYDIILRAAGGGGHEPFVFYDIILMVAGGGGGGNGTGGGGDTHLDASLNSLVLDHEPFVFYDIILMVDGGNGGGLVLDHEPFVFYDIILMSAGGGGGGTGGSGDIDVDALVLDHEPFVFYDIILRVAGGSGGSTRDHEPFVFYDIILMSAGNGGGNGSSSGSEGGGRIALDHEPFGWKRTTARSPGRIRSA